MGANHSKSRRSRMRGLLPFVRDVQGSELRGLFFFNEIGLKAASGFRSDLPWTWVASFPSAYPFQPSGL